jgi:hypothetical protein
LADLAFESGCNQLRARNAEFGRYGFVGSDGNPDRLSGRGFAGNRDDKLGMFHVRKASWQWSMRFVRNTADCG